MHRAMVAWPGLVCLIWAAGGCREQAPDEIASRVVLIAACSDSSLSLVGTWQNGRGWRPAKDGDMWPLLMPEEGTWRLYALGREPMEVTSGPPVLSTMEQGDGTIREFWYSAPLLGPTARSVQVPERGLAVARARREDRAMVTVLPNEDDPVVEWTRQELVRRGLRPARTEGIVQNISVDLNGDRRMDRVLALRLEGSDSTSYVVAVIDRSGGDRTASVLVAPSVDVDYPYMLDVTVVAVADIDGDGFKEVAVEWVMSDGYAVEIHSLSGKAFQRVIEQFFVGA